jgi:hypothetical protein
VIPLGGGQLARGGVDAELLELQRISARVFALVDSERPAGGADPLREREEFAGVCARVGIKLHLTDRRATENYFPERAVEAVLGSSFRALGEFERLADVPNGWPKSANWRIAREMTDTELLSTDVGQFLLTI